MLTAAAIHSRAQAAINSGRHGTARRLLVTAGERTQDPDLLSRIDASLAYTEAERGEVSEAMRRCRHALARAGIGEETRGVLTSQLGLLHMRVGDVAEALRLFDLAIPALVSHVDRGRAHLNRGNVHLQRGLIAAALADFTAAEVLLTERAPIEQAMAVHNRGYAELLTGRLVEALRDMERAAPVLAPLSPVSQAIGQQDRAEVLIAAGLISEGDRELQAAARAYGARGLRQFQGEAEVVRARMLVLADAAAAARLARRAARRFRARGSDSWAIRADAIALMADVSAGGRSRRLLDDADRLCRELRRHGLRPEASRVGLYAVRLLVRRRELDAAAARLRGIRLRPDDPLPSRLLRREVRADLALARGQSTRALSELRHGVDELHDWQSSFGSLDLQSNLVGHGRQLVLDGLRLALRSGEPTLILEWSERARMLRSRLAEIKPPEDAGVAAELAELRFLQSQSPDPESAEGRRLSQLRMEIRQHAWFEISPGEVTVPAEPGLLQAALGEDDAVMVSFVGVGGEITALVADERGLTVHALGPMDLVGPHLVSLAAGLDMMATDLSAVMAEVVSADTRRELAVLDRHLLAPLAARLGSGRVVITPSGGLAELPWSLLPSLAGRPVAVPQSAAHWLHVRSRPALPLLRVGLVAGPGVRRAAAEIRASAAAWPTASVIDSDAATPAAVSELAATVDVLHVAAHGGHVADNPLFSAVELSGGAWFGYDVDRLARVPRVVLLPACELGRATVRNREYQVGMTAAWLHSGAHCVVAAPSLLSDAAAGEILPLLHRGLAGGQAPAEALAAALTATDHMAPLVCYGNGW